MKIFRLLFNLLVVIYFIGIASSCISQKNKKPNILFILVDDLGWADLGYTGSTFYETLNIDKLAAEGTVFTNAYGAVPPIHPSQQPNSIEACHSERSEESLQY